MTLNLHHCILARLDQQRVETAGIRLREMSEPFPCSVPAMEKNMRAACAATALAARALSAREHGLDENSQEAGGLLPRSVELAEVRAR